TPPTRGRWPTRSTRRAPRSRPPPPPIRSAPPSCSSSRKNSRTPSPNNKFQTGVSASWRLSDALQHLRAPVEDRGGVAADELHRQLDHARVAQDAAMADAGDRLELRARPRG